MTKKILITGHEGYIGSVMAPAFLKAGYDVVGLDTGLFRECTLVPELAKIPAIHRDLRDLKPQELKQFDAVVHLAALSTDPIGNLRQDWTEDINFRASVRLAEMAKAAGVRRFLFSSSCIMYGMSEASVATEDSPLDPQTEYARSKVKSEQGIGELADDHFSPVFLRNGTVYGLSPHMRFDTVFNDLIAAGLTTGEIIVFSDGKPWRPVVHVSDVARAFLTVLEAPVEKIHNQAFNTGADHLNCRIRELAEIAVRTVPGTKLEIKAQASADQRTYKADFSKFARTFPNFEFQCTPEKGARHLYESLRDIGLTYEQFRDRKFTRLKWLRYLLDTNQVDEALRWNQNGVNRVAV